LGLNRIVERFAQLKARNEKAFIPFITAGDPTLAITKDLVLEFDKAGADVIELGVPFSDPLADGVVIQEAAQRALKHHVSLRHVLAMVKEIRAESEVPILLFSYYNPVLAYGTEELARDSKDAGIDGILCVDLPPEEATEYIAAFKEHDLATVFLAAPTSTAERIEIIAKCSSGFVYYVSRTGVTGEQESMESSVRGMVAKIKEHTNLPVAVGFGIAKPEQAAEVGEYADGVVVGSAIVRLIGELGDSPDTPLMAGALVKSLADASKGKG
jgi:tryptophan synthase alpha chain